MSSDTKICEYHALYLYPDHIIWMSHVHYKDYQTESQSSKSTLLSRTLWMDVYISEHSGCEKDYRH